VGFAFGVGENTIMASQRKVRHPGFADIEFLDSVTGFVGRRLRPVAFSTLHALHIAGDAVRFDVRSGQFLTAGGDRVHPRTITALTSARLLVRDPSADVPAYRVSAKGESVLRAVEAQQTQPAPSSSQQHEVQSISIGSDK
jgi:hypothetical protein